jgi:hypothetical protein
MEKTKKIHLKRSEILLPPEDWQKKTLSFMDESQVTLLHGPDGNQAREYLQNRCISQPSWFTNLLGFTMGYDSKLKRRRPAIVIPHFDNSFVVNAVKLRFIDDESEGLRYTSRKGSKPILYGLHTAFDHHKTLFLVEGELNAISVQQCICEGVSVLSFGSENISRVQKELLQVLARRFKRVIIWTDKAEKAQEAEKAIGFRCELFKSPYSKDANDLLTEGILPDFLREILKR